MYIFIELKMKMWIQNHLKMVISKLNSRLSFICCVLSLVVGVHAVHCQQHSIIIHLFKMTINFIMNVSVILSFLAQQKKNKATNEIRISRWEQIWIISSYQ